MFTADVFVFAVRVIQITKPPDVRNKRRLNAVHTLHATNSLTFLITKRTASNKGAIGHFPPVPLKVRKRQHQSTSITNSQRERTDRRLAANVAEAALECR